ncbi:hypothetical protein AB1Y20_002503 [Prymnesium parvum]|uniref:EF-hand domain-containing protein n=1 Tax=Prymnesium parvum TaxID=97485 RepID=A0AB34J852_PRYPA
MPPLSPAELERRREENIRKKEEERHKKVEEIKAKKAVKSAERATEREKQERAKQAEEARRNELKEKEKKRAARIAEIEAERAKKAQSESKTKTSGVKYPKKDVLELKAVFDSYDDSKDGKISLREFTASMAKNKKPSSTSSRDGKRDEGISLADMGESLFREMDVDGSGEVTFSELLKLMYPYATAHELEVMAKWVAPEKPPEPEKVQELSSSQRTEMKQMFALYDKDKSGTISKAELHQALQKTGLSREDIKELFDNADTSGDDSINLEEFMELMESTGMYS